MGRGGAVWWLYLCTNLDPSIKTNSRVALSADPERAVSAAQRPAAQVGGWRLDLVIGPVGSRSAGERLVKSWRHSSRGIASRRKEGYKLFAQLSAEPSRRGEPAAELFDAGVAG
jgi:hypothetical protein